MYMILVLGATAAVVFYEHPTIFTCQPSCMIIVVLRCYTKAR